MPVIRKIITAGDSRAVTLPKSWIDFAEKESGQKITQVSMEIDGEITIKPVLLRRKPKT